jgi:hypothetical protein
METASSPDKPFFSESCENSRSGKGCVWPIGGKRNNTQQNPARDKPGDMVLNKRREEGPGCLGCLIGLPRAKIPIKERRSFSQKPRSFSSACAGRRIRIVWRIIIFPVNIFAPGRKLAVAEKPPMHNPIKSNNYETQEHPMAWSAARYRFIFL